MKTTVTIVVMALLLFAIPVQGQEVYKHHHIADKKFWLSVGLAVAATVADAETTAHCVKMRSCVEGTMLYGQRPSRAKLYGVNAPITGISVFLAYAMKHDRYEKTWWIPLAPVTALHGYAAIHNIQTINRLERRCPTGTVCTFHN